MNPRVLQTWLLRLTGSVEFGAFVAVAMPRQWMEAGHTWLGLGEMPEGAIVNFIIRQASFTYGLHGVLLWLLSWEVVRFYPLVVFTGISYVVAAPVFFHDRFDFGDALVLDGRRCGFVFMLRQRTALPCLVGT